MWGLLLTSASNTSLRSLNNHSNANQSSTVTSTVNSISADFAINIAPLCADAIRAAFGYCDRNILSMIGDAPCNSALFNQIEQCGDNVTDSHLNLNLVGSEVNFRHSCIDSDQAIEISSAFAASKSGNSSVNFHVFCEQPERDCAESILNFHNFFDAHSQDSQQNIVHLLQELRQTPCDANRSMGEDKPTPIITEDEPANITEDELPIDVVDRAVKIAVFLLLGPMALMVTLMLPRIVVERILSKRRSACLDRCGEDPLRHARRTREDTSRVTEISAQV